MGSFAESKGPGKRESGVLLALFVYSLVPVLGGLLRAVELSAGFHFLPPNPRAQAFPLSVVAHTLASAIFCLGGAVQLMPGIRHSRPILHQRLGRVVLPAGLVVAATGMWMTLSFNFPVELQGTALCATRLAVSCMMLVLLYRAVAALRRRDYHCHGAQLLRAYALGLGASTQAVLGLAWMLLFRAELLGPARDAMMLLAWVANALVAEYLIRRHLKPRQSRQSPQSKWQQVDHRQDSTPLTCHDGGECV
ncbi:MAG: DUF2306 domain-containing protein [Halieaceae bacterium]|jgi:hypothetical protein|nr:DUF2306 domain-containing protein [Halieaceae bacterium]